MDLDQWYAAGRWVALLELIDMLPTACRLNEAIANNPETARVLASLPESTEKWTPRISEYDLSAIMHREMLAAMASIQGAIVATAGGKPTPYKPFPVPRTAIDRARADMEREFVEDLAGLFGFDAADIA
ncbi:hypothetical protein [Arthrobacter sp. Z1-15]